MTEIERVQFKLMLPAHLKAALEEAAHDNRRSLSAEIIERLHQTLDAEENAVGGKPAVVVPDAVYQHLDDIVERVIQRVRKEEREAGLSPLEMDFERDARIKRDQQE